MHTASSKQRTRLSCSSLRSLTGKAIKSASSSGRSCWAKIKRSQSCRHRSSRCVVSACSCCHSRGQHTEHATLPGSRWACWINLKPSAQHSSGRPLAYAHCPMMQVQALNNERIEQIQQAAAAREMELQTEFESLSNEMMERIEQLQEEVQGLLEFKQHKASLKCQCWCAWVGRQLVTAYRGLQPAAVWVGTTCQVPMVCGSMAWPTRKHLWSACAVSMTLNEQHCLVLVLTCRLRLRQPCQHCGKRQLVCVRLWMRSAHSWSGTMRDCMQRCARSMSRWALSPAIWHSKLAQAHALQLAAVAAGSGPGLDRPNDCGGNSGTSVARQQDDQDSMHTAGSPVAVVSAG